MLTRHCERSMAIHFYEGIFMINIDKLVDGIIESYDTYGLVNRNDAENFPNRQTVVSILSDVQSLIFPGFRTE